MAKTVDWLGQSGETYAFNLYEIGANFKSVPGVYIFAKFEGDTLAPIYIGEAEDLKVRLTTKLDHHESYPCVQEYGATHLCTKIVTGGNQARLDIETDLRHGYQPPCNKQ